jgi:glycerol-1-phosphate dehydrogenase [NAD(P)+]
MEPHSIQLPREVIVGNGVIERMGEICGRLGLNGNALVLSGGTTRKIAGERIREILSKKQHASLSVVREASFSEADRICAANGGFDFVVGAGGGKVIDMGKLVATKRQVPFVSVPTAPSHDGIASERVTIHTENEKASVRADAPVGVVADIRILRSAPYRLIASGCADAVSNYTAVHDWKLGRNRGEYYSEYAASLSLLAADIVMGSAEMIRVREERGIRNLVEALVSSGIAMSMVDSSRPASGAEHMFSHALDYLESPGLHGEQCGLGSIITAELQGQDWARIRESLALIGAPVTIEQLGISEEVFVKAFLEARDIRRERYTILDEVALTKDKILRAGRTTGVLKP